jgi:hypothetical protein
MRWGLNDGYSSSTGLLRLIQATCQILCMSITVLLATGRRVVRMGGMRRSTSRKGDVFYWKSLLLGIDIECGSDR